jgi:hypothetical protein
MGLSLVITCEPWTGGGAAVRGTWRANHKSGEYVVQHCRLTGEPPTCNVLTNFVLDELSLCPLAYARFHLDGEREIEKSITTTFYYLYIQITSSALKNKSTESINHYSDT